MEIRRRGPITFSITKKKKVKEHKYIPGKEAEVFADIDEEFRQLAFAPLEIEYKLWKKCKLCPIHKMPEPKKPVSRIVSPH